MTEYVLNPTGEGRQQLTDAIRAALLRDEQLGDESIVARVLEPRGLARAEAAQARSYQPGDIVMFRKGEKGPPRLGIGYRVEGADAEAGTVRLTRPAPRKVVLPSGSMGGRPRWSRSTRTRACSWSATRPASVRRST